MAGQVGQGHSPAGASTLPSSFLRLVHCCLVSAAACRQHLDFGVSESGATARASGTHSRPRVKQTFSPEKRDEGN